MDDDTYTATVAKLSPSRKVVYDAIHDYGPIDDHELGAILGTDSTQSGFTTRRNDLLKMGLVRVAFMRGRRRVWELTPAADVEKVRDEVAQEGPRLRVIRRFRDLPLETRFDIAMAIADDEELQDAIGDPAGSATRRQRSAYKKAVSRRDREKRRADRELRDALEQKAPGVEAMQFRKILREANDAMRAIRALYDEERERRVILGETGVSDEEWERILREIEEDIRQHEKIYEMIAALIDAPSRVQVDYEISEDEVIEDGEYELVKALGLESAGEAP